MYAPFMSPPCAVSQKPSQRLNQPAFAWASSQGPVSCHSAIASCSRPRCGRFEPMNRTAFSLAMVPSPSLWREHGDPRDADQSVAARFAAPASLIGARADRGEAETERERVLDAVHPRVEGAVGVEEIEVRVADRALDERVG